MLPGQCLGHGELAETLTAAGIGCGIVRASVNVTGW